MPKTQKKLFTVKCGICGKEFEKLIEILEGTENQKTEQTAYCPWCEHFVTFTIDGKPPKVFILKRKKT
jgi:DNA-directed RNA polymerase subunit RPC12/RpoP